MNEGKKGKRDSSRQRGINYSYFLPMCQEDATIFKLERSHSKCWLFGGHRFISREIFTSQTQNSLYSTLSKCTNKALGGCCNYFSGFCPANAAHFPCGSPKIGGKPELALVTSSIHSSAQALVHLIYIRLSKGTNELHKVDGQYMVIKITQGICRNIEVKFKNL